MHEREHAAGVSTRTVVNVHRAAPHIVFALLCAGQASAQPAAPQDTLKPPVTPSVLDLTFGDASIPPLPPLETDVKAGPAARLVIECPRCSTDDRLAPAPASNAPWSAGVGASFAVSGTRLGLSLRANRNYRLPRYTAQPLGMTGDTTPAWASLYSDLTSNRTEWTVSARVERTLKTLRGGQTISVVGDAWTPVNTRPDPARNLSGGSSAVSTDVPLLPSRAVRFGVTFAF